MTPPQHDLIVQALKTALETLDGTIPVCQGIADAGQGYVCTGCPAEKDGVCEVQMLRNQIEALVGDDE